MFNTEKYVAIEITSKRIRLLIGYMLDGKVYVIDALETKTQGVNDGMVVDVDAVSSSLNELKHKAEKDVGFTITYCDLVIPPLGIFVTENQGNVGTTNYKGVEQRDIESALNFAKNNINLMGDLKIIDTRPIYFVLDDGEKYILPPLSKPSNTLTVYAKVYAISRKVLQGFSEVLAKLKIKVNNYIISPLAVAEYLSLDEKHPSHYLLLNIGDEITNLAYIQNRNEVDFNTCYHFGSSSINNALKDNLNLDDEMAEKYKLIYGFDKDPSFKFSLEKGITLSSISKVILDSINPTLTKVQKEVETCSKKENRSLSLLLCGGGSKLKGLTDYLESLGIEAFNVEINSLGARDITYLPLLGAIAYAARKNSNKGKNGDNSNMEFGLSRLK